MRYGSSEAVRLDGYDMRAPRRAASGNPSFDVYEGGGADAEARRGVTPEFISRAIKIAAVVIVFVAISFTRVALSVATASTLAANAQIESRIDEASALANDLKVSKSALSSPNRIERIASQNYHMVLLEPEVLQAPQASQGSAGAEVANSSDAR